ncbi:MAG: glycoside hydrolase family 3 C-terminal domain-containing protein [Lentisphaeria bacterium]|nr:glycoside hydrolase family 3 C-terminal domain-containing protein [Lentisphaeria bacterium]
MNIHCKTLVDEKIENLLVKMTVSEKIGQLNQLAFNVDGTEDEIRKGLVGSFLNIEGAEEANRLQKIAVEESRLGIPLVLARDVIHGHETLFPIPIAQSCSWNEELVEKGAHIAAIEAKCSGYHWTFAPMIDISRDPRWGRIAESLGEDTLLCGRIGAAMVRGFQGDDASAMDRVAACAKHFIGYGAAEAGRDYNTTYIPERTLRNTYLPPFKDCMDAGALTMMSSFNEINDIPASAYHFTLKQILRDEWSYDGMVVSDWDSVGEMIAHGFVPDRKEAAFESIEAGVDMDMFGESYIKNAEQLINEGRISVETIDEAVRNVLRLKFKLNLFENPYFQGDVDQKIGSKEHLEASLKAAHESMILLKNEDVLPLDPLNKVALIGFLADSEEDQVGCWSMDFKAGVGQTVKQAFELSDIDFSFNPGIVNTCSCDESKIADAVNQVESADVAVLVLGEEAILSGESHSRAFIDLPGVQEKLIDEVAKTGKPIILVVMAGRPLTLDNILDKVDAVLYAWHPGSMAGPAIYDLLYGNVNPSGRLSVSFPRFVGQIPCYYNHKNTGRPPQPSNLGIPTGTPLDPEGFGAFYLDCDYTAQFPFGYGLSYSKISYRNITLNKTIFDAEDALQVSVELINESEFFTQEVVQVYHRDLVASVTRPIKELLEFKKVTLEASETKVVNFEIPIHKLGFYDRKMKFSVEPGEFQLWVAPDSNSGEPISFEVQ